jgi:hypothetical protein
MTYYDPFDCKVNCEEIEHYDTETELPAKDYLGGYQNNTDGPTYNGIAI